MRWTLTLSLVLLLACGDDDTPTDAGVDATDVGSPDSMADTAEDAPDFDSAFDAGPPPPGNTCATVVDVNRDGAIDAEGVLRIRRADIAATQDLETCDRGVGVKISDVVFQYTAPAEGELRWSLESVGDPVLYWVDTRTVCDDSETTVDCDECGGRCAQAVVIEEGATLYFVVTRILTAGPAGTGFFDLAFELLPYGQDGDACSESAPPPCAPRLECQDEDGVDLCGVCGDGFIAYGIACDDGNMDDGDGCSAACEPDVQGAGGGTCAAATALNLVDTRLGEIIQIAYADGTMDTVDDHAADCAAGDGPESVYVFTLATMSDVTIEVAGSDVVSLYDGGSACVGAALTCAVDGDDDATVTLSRPALPAGSYFIVIDRNAVSAAADASYSLQLFAEPL